MPDYAEQIFWIKSCYSSTNGISNTPPLPSPPTSFCLSVWLAISLHPCVSWNTCNIDLVFITPSIAPSHSPTQSCLFPRLLSLHLSLCLQHFSSAFFIHHILMPCQLSSPSHHVSGKVRVTSTQCSASPPPSLHPSLKAWSSISSSHYAQTSHGTNSRSYEQPHTLYPLSSGGMCMCVRWSLILHSDLLFQIAIVINCLSLAGLYWLQRE